MFKGSGRQWVNSLTATAKNNDFSMSKTQDDIAKFADLKTVERLVKITTRKIRNECEDWGLRRRRVNK